MRFKSTTALLLGLTLPLALAACGDDGGGKASGGALRIGAYASFTGTSAAPYKSFVPALEARIEAYKTAGGKCASREIELFEADETSTPEGSLKAAMQLVQQDQVDVVVTPSPFFFAASQFAAQQEDTLFITTGAEGAAEYKDVTNNLFGVIAPPQYEATYTEPGNYYTAKGVTKMSLIASDNPSASASLEQIQDSLTAVGIEFGYVNKKIPYGFSDVGPIVQGIIDSGSDGLFSGMLPETSFAVVEGLRQAGYMKNMKIVHLATGYGADLLKSEPAVRAAQGVSFSTAGWVPNEVGGEGVETMSETLKTYTDNESGVPGWGEAMGYLEADLLLYALDKAGCDATGPELIEAIRTDDQWNAGGLLSNTRDFGTTEVAENCSYVLTLEDHTFEPDPQASPMCGQKVD